MSREQKKQVLSFTLIINLFMIPAGLWIAASAYSGEITKPRENMMKAQEQASKTITELAILIHKNVENDLKERGELRKDIEVHEVKDEAVTSYILSEIEVCRDNYKILNKH